MRGDPAANERAGETLIRAKPALNTNVTHVHVIVMESSTAPCMIPSPHVAMSRIGSHTGERAFGRQDSKMTERRIWSRKK